MTVESKGSTIGMQTNVQRIIPRLRAIEGFEVSTELTRVGPAWRHAISEPDTMESEPPPNFEEDASQALHDFRTEQDRRRRNMVPVMFVMGCSIGILLALIPDSRFFRNHILHAAAPPRAVLPATAPASPPPEVQSGLAMSPIDVHALMPTSMPMTATIAAAPQMTTPKHPHASSAVTRSASPAPVAKTSSSHPKARSTNDDEETVRNAHAADDLAAAQLTDSL